MFRVFLYSGRTTGFGDRKTPAGQQQIGKGEQRIELRGVLGQAAITRFSMTEQILDDMERMLDFRPDAGLQMLQLFRQASQFIVGQRLAFEALHGHVPCHRLADVFGPFFHALIAGVAERGGLVAVQQRRRHCRPCR